MKFLPPPVLRLSIVLVSLLCTFPAVSEAALAGGGTTTTMTCTYVKGVKKWILRIDPLNVQAFQLDIMLDPARAQLDQTLGTNGIVYISPFTQTTPANFSLLGAGLLQDVAGAAPPALTSPGDVDIFELQFFDLQPGLPFTTVPFTVFASPNDYIVGFDPATMQSVTFDFTQIAPTTCMATTGTTVPDGGRTVALLSMALVALEGSRRKLRRSAATL